MTSEELVTFDSYKDINAYVISLERERWRYAVARKDLVSLGFSNIIRWKATDYKTEDCASEMRTLGATRLDRFYNCAEMACVLSHLRVMYDFLRSNEPYCFIFEDDVVPIENFDEVSSFGDIHYGDFDLLCFGGFYTGPSYDLWGLKSDLSQIEEAKKLGKSYIDNCCFQFSHAYLISRKAAYQLTRDYASWASSVEHRMPQLDVYISSNSNIRRKLLVNQNIPHRERYMAAGDRLCGILMQRAEFKSTIVKAT